MLINVNELNHSLTTLNQLLDDYNKTFLIMYNNLSSIPFLWNDTNSKKFLMTVDTDKKNINKLINDLNSYRDIYSYIKESYGKLGNIIYYELEYKNSIFGCFDSYIDKLTSIISKYNNLNLSAAKSYYVTNAVLSEKEKLKNNLSLVNSIYSQVKDFYEVVDEISLNVSQMLSKIEVNDIQEIIVNDYI